MKTVNVMDMLAARDARVARQDCFRERYRAPLVSFTMNIAGEIKRDPAIDRAFFEGKRRILRQLQRMNAEILEYEENLDFTGCEGLWAVASDEQALKDRMCLVEEADELGRLLDIDVIDPDGHHLSRKSERPCLICGEPVRACARSRRHTAQELFARTHEIIEAHFAQQYAERIGEAAQKALLYEAITTPKPGLVDRLDSGAHRDMDLFSFAASAAALRPYYEKCARMGRQGRDFDQLQYAGQDAEDRMYAAVGANTHKGAIFALGILCHAAGSCGEGAAIEDILQNAACLGEKSLEHMRISGKAETGGERQYREYGLTGARGEAASGFRSVREIALPALESAIDRGENLNDAGTEALLALMSRVHDSNIIRRAGMDGQRWVMQQAGEWLENGAKREALAPMNRAFIEKNISPGGCADLLALAYFLHFLKSE